jgi:hypothetical protein
MLRKQLDQTLVSQYIQPASYNDEQEVKRAFKVHFLHTDEFLKIDNVNQFILDLSDGDTKNYRPDGYFFAIVLENQTSREEIIKKVKEITHQRVVFAVPKIAQEIQLAAQKHFAIEELIKIKADDPVLVEELTFMKNDLMELLINYTSSTFLQPEQFKVEYIYQGLTCHIKRKSGLSQKFSEICNNIYIHTPKIVNESINRDVISAPTSAAREKIILGLLQPELKAKLGLPSNQEVVIARSVYVVTGIMENFDTDDIRINLNVQNIRFQHLFTVIRDFILQSVVSELSFAELYNTLTNPDLGIGLKKGLIPFYIAASFVADKRHIVIKNKGREVPLTARTIIDINEKPQDYTIRLQNWDDGKQRYLNALETIYSRYANISNREYASFDYIVEGMKKWFSNLSKFDRETHYYCSDSLELIQHENLTIQFRKWLSSSDLNASELLFERLPNSVSGGGYDNVVLYLVGLKSKIDLNISNHIRRIATFLKKLFNSRNGASLSSVLRDYFDLLKEETKLQVFNGAATYLLDAMRSDIRDENEIIFFLLKGIIGLRIEDFTDKIIGSVEDLLLRAKQKIDDYNNAIIRDGALATKAYTFSYNENGKEITKKITINELPPQSNNLKNDLQTMLFEEFGESLSATEKGQILFEMLKELCK